MHVPGLIEKKRDGGELAANEIQEVVAGFTGEEIPDYQMSALAMAIFFQGMADAETWQLTEAMMRSGRVLSYPAGSPPKVDKHSTGGIGDKTSLVLAPLLACGDVWMPMISGRDLGITGGTLDKLESIPEFNVNLDETRALNQLEKIGVFMIGQTADIARQTKSFTPCAMSAVPCRCPLIVASIMSKKLAENLDRLVLDVKFGAGAFMKTRPEAELLAEAMAKVGSAMDVKMSHVLSPMEEPLGRSVGNALEVAECVEILHGGGPADVIELVLELASKVANSSREKLAGWLNDGTAWKKFVALVEAQDGDAGALEEILKSHCAPVIREVAAGYAGRIARMDAEKIGRASLLLGGGRSRSDDAIDFAVGLSDLKKIGEKVERNEPLMRVHARDNRSLEEVLPLLKEAAVVE